MEDETVENCSRIKDIYGMQAVEEDNAQKNWKEYFQDLYNADTEEKGTIIMHLLMV